MNVFYSWQADTPDKIGRDFIRQSLMIAVETVSSEMGLSEAERPQIDQDTKGILGSPSIADTILLKIAYSNVFVADVTLVGSVNDSKKLLNSNVVYELGYAHGKLSDKALLTIMNTHYGPPEQLPFDLLHRRWPVRFCLSPESTREQRKEERKKLSTELAKILKNYLEDSSVSAAPKTYKPTKAKSNAAVYWDTTKPLTENGFSYAEKQPMVYLRIWPDMELEKLTNAQLFGPGVARIPPLLFDHHHTKDRNKNGSIYYCRDEDGDMAGSTQIFKNREVWGINSLLLAMNQREDFSSFPMGYFEERLRESLTSYIYFCSNTLKYNKLCNIEFGMVNVEGLKLAMPQAQYFEGFWGAIFDDFSIQLSIDMEDPESIKNALLKIFKKVFDEAGVERPKNFNGYDNESE